MIRIGEMRHQIRIERRTTTQDAAGEPLQTWTLVVERRASIQHTPGSEVWASSTRNGRVPTVFRMRYEDGITPDMRIVCEGKKYNILSAVDQAHRREELIITAEELVGE